MILVLDIGNSQTVFGFYDEKSECQGDFRVDSDVNYKPAFLCRLLTRKMQEFELDNIDAVVIASVVPRLTTHYSACLKELTGLSPFVITHDAYQLSSAYYTLNQLGIDRLCNVAAVKELYGNSVAVIDFGTAITVEVVDGGGGFAGGLILPGIRLQSEALGLKTAQLPKVELTFPAKVIGRSTEECIRSGIMWGTAELCRGVLGRIRTELKLEKMRVVATGGYAGLFAEAVPEIDLIIPDLVPKGALAIYRMQQQF